MPAPSSPTGAERLSVSRGPRLVAILSISRSGSSLLARLLGEALRVDFGEPIDHLPANHSNPDGFVEDLRIVEFNEEVLRAVNAGVFEPPAREAFADVERFASYERRLCSLLTDLGRRRPIFGIKDPRLALTLPLYRRVWSEMVPVIIYRNPLASAASMSEQTSIGIADALDLWFEYYFRILKGTSGLDRYVLSFERLIADPVMTCRGLTDYLGLDSTGLASRVEGIVDPGRVHHRAETLRPETSPYLAPAAKVLYAKLESALASGGQPDFEELGALVSSLDFYSTRHRPGGGGPVDDLLREQADRLHGHLAQREREAELARAELEEAKADLQRRGRQELDEVRDELARSRAESQSLLQEVTKAEQRLDAAEGSLRQARLEADHHRNEAGALQTRMVHLEQEVATKLDSVRRGLYGLAGRSRLRRLRVAPRWARSHPGLGGLLGRNPVRTVRTLLSLLRQRRSLRAAAASGLFDPDVYASSSLELLVWGGALLDHYLLMGAFEGRNPCSLFDTRWYVETYPDVATSTLNPLVHYWTRGAEERRDPHPLFSTAHYLRTNPDVERSGENPLAHYLRQGGHDGRDPHPWFDTEYYLEQVPEASRPGVNPLVHYLDQGAAEGRDPSPGFDTARYLQMFPEVEASGLNPLVHRARVERAGATPPPTRELEAKTDVLHGIEAPTRASDVLIGEPVVIRGWCALPDGAVDSVWLCWPDGEVRASYPEARPDLKDRTGDGFARAVGYEAILRLTTRGVHEVRVEGRRADGGVVELGRLVPLSVSGERFCEPLLLRCPTPRCFAVLFVDGIGSQFASRRYRIDHLREALELAGIESQTVSSPELYEDLSMLRRFDILVLFRVPNTFHIRWIVEQARLWNVPVVFDVDDYIFEPKIASPDIIAGIAGWANEQVEEYRRGVRLYRGTLETSDCMTGTTPYLAERARELGKPSYVIRNFLSQRQVDLSRPLRRALERGRPIGAGVDIIYLSGTPTHQRDFAVAAGPLAEVLAEHEHVTLTVVGFLDLDAYPELLPHRARIRKREFVPWDQLQHVVRRSDIAIAPLQVGNPFCEAKSQLKFFEGAVHGLAVVASGTQPFRDAIDDGETGFVCSDASEWKAALGALVKDAELRRGIAQRGAVSALNHFGPVRGAAEAVQVYRSVIEQKRESLGLDAGSLSVSWLVPEIIAGSGGHNDIFIAANEMVKRGHRVALYFDTQGSSSSESVESTRSAIREIFGYEPLFQIGRGFGDIPRSDALIATHNATAHVAERMAGRAFLRAYFVQDYEPLFYPVGPRYFHAEMTYRLDFLYVTLGPWLRRLLEKRHGACARSIDFWVDRRYYSPPVVGPPREGRRVVFYARPQMPRRAYELGLEALRRLTRRRPDVEVCLFGARKFPGASGLPCRKLGVLRPTELAELYRSADVALAFSTTNPSLATFEMMACGLPVVDLDVLDALDRHGEYPAILTDADPQAIASTLERVLGDAFLRETHGRRGVEFTASMPSAAEALSQVSAIIEERVLGGV